VSRVVNVSRKVEACTSRDLTQERQHCNASMLAVRSRCVEYTKEW
jgi:hypothetical protein